MTNREYYREADAFNNFWALIYKQQLTDCTSTNFIYLVSPTDLDKFDKVSFIALRPLFAVRVPTNRIVPVEVKTLEAVAPQECHDTGHQGAPRAATADDPRVLVSCGVGPASEREQHLSGRGRQCGETGVELWKQREECEHGRWYDL